MQRTMQNEESSLNAFMAFFLIKRILLRMKVMKM